MPDQRATEDLAVFESHRPAMLALAYRMLGDVGRAQDMVQEAWLRWHQRDIEVDSPRAFLVTVVTRVCLNEVSSARVRREESRRDRLPVFDFAHEEIAPLVSRSAAACRKLLERARHKVAAGRRLVSASREEHQQLLGRLLPRRFRRRRRRPGGPARTGCHPDHGRRHRGACLQGPAQPSAAAGRRGAHRRVRGGDVEQRQLNGRPALVFYGDGRPFAAVLLAVADGKIQRVFFHADLSRLRYLGHDQPRMKSVL